jgi:Cys-tRNA(Pro) deacylase
LYGGVGFAGAGAADVWPEPVERVARELRAAAVEATVQEFREGTPTAEAAANAVGSRLDQIVKSLVFICDGAYVLVMVPGDRRADERLVAEAAGAQEVRVARAAEVVEATGFEPGGVAPFPLEAIEDVFIERTLLQHDRVWIGAGSPSHMAGLPPTDLQRLSGARTADLVTPR